MQTASLSGGAVLRWVDISGCRAKTWRRDGVTFRGGLPHGHSMNSMVSAGRARSFAAMLQLLLVVVGLPLLVWTQIGSPTQWEFPSWSELASVLKGQRSPEQIIPTLIALVALFLWIQVLVAICSGIRNFRTGREAQTRLVAAPLGRWMFSLLVSVAPIFTQGVAAGAASHSRDSSVSNIVKTHQIAASSVAASDNASNLTSSTGNRVHTVEQGESLWSITEQYFGNGRYWEALAQFNEGRDQPGGVFSAAAAHINPGWTLEIPPIGAIIPEAGGEHRSSQSQDSIIEVVPGDTLWDLAEEHLGDPFRWDEVFAANEGVLQADHQRLVDPDLILPGWELVVPDGTAQTNIPLGSDPASMSPLGTDDSVLPQERTEVPAVAPPVASPAEAKEIPATPEGEDRQDTSASWHESPSLRWGVLGATAAWMLIGARRRRDQRGSTSSRHFQFPTPQAAARSQSLLRYEVPNREGLCEAMTEVIGTNSVDTICWDGSRLGIAAPGTSATAGTWGWKYLGGTDQVSSPTPSESVDHFSEGDAAHPLWAGMWTSLGYDSTGLVIARIDGTAPITVDGPHQGVDGLIGNILLELDGGALVPAGEVVVIGSRLGAIARVLDLQGRVRAIDEVAQIADYVRATTRALRSAHEDHGARNIRPIVIVAASGDAELLRLQQETAGAPGIGYINVGRSGLDGERVIDLSGPKVHLEHLGLLLDPLPISEITGVVVTEVDEPELPESVCSFDISEAAFPAELPNGLSVGRESDEISGVVLRLFGNPRVVAPATSLSARHVECLAYLSLHEHCESQVVKTALWPARAPSDSRWSSFLSELRSALGTTDSGELMFPHLRGGGLRLAVPLRNDVDDLARAYEQFRDGVGCDPALLDPLLSSLRSIEGGLLQGARGYEWAYAEGFVGFAERIVGEACHLITERATNEHEYSFANEAIEYGMRVLPGSELLYQDRMRLAHARGDQSAVERTFRELVDALDAEDAGAEPHPETLQLRANLSDRVSR